jgi:hypothetical protein
MDSQATCDAELRGHAKTSILCYSKVFDDVLRYRITCLVLHELQWATHSTSACFELGDIFRDSMLFESSCEQSRLMNFNVR